MVMRNATDPAIALTLLPSMRGGYFHCCVCPVDAEYAWPGSISEEERPWLLVEYDLEGEATALPGWATVDEQLGPEAVIRNLRLLGTPETLDGHGLPIAAEALLSPPGENHIHYFTSVLPAPEAVATEAWREASAGIKHTLLPDDWSRLAHCAAIFHYMDGEFAYLLSPDQELWSAWIDAVIARCFPLVAAYPAALRTVRDWVFASFADRGGTLLDVRIDHGDSVLRINATLGRPETVPLQLGMPSNIAVAVTLPMA
jgi:hypothetical protein